MVGLVGRVEHGQLGARRRPARSRPQLDDAPLVEFDPGSFWTSTPSASQGQRE